MANRELVVLGTASRVTRLLITHFHGDHCLGVPGVLQRMSLDRVAHPVLAYYPAVNAEVFWRLRHASLFHDTLTLVEHPVDGDGVVADRTHGAGNDGLRLEAQAPRTARTCWCASRHSPTRTRPRRPSPAKSR